MCCPVRLPACDPFGRIWRSGYVGESRHLHVPRRPGTYSGLPILHFPFAPLALICTPAISLSFSGASQQLPHSRIGLIFLSVGRIRLRMDITTILHDCSLDGETGYAAICAEFPEANGQGETPQAAIQNLREAIRDIIDYRRDEVRKLLVASDRIEVIAA